MRMVKWISGLIVLIVLALSCSPAGQARLFETAESAAFEARSLEPVGVFDLYYHWIFDPEHEPVTPSGIMVDLLDIQDQVLATVDENLARRYAMEGKGILPDGRMIQLVNDMDYPYGRFKIVDPALAPWGYDFRGEPLVLYKSAAVDPLIIPLGTSFYIQEMDGLILPDLTVHDGWFIAQEASYHFSGQSVDLFIGTYENFQYFESKVAGLRQCTVSIDAATTNTLRIITSPGGFASPSGEVVLGAGSSATITITPDTGFVTKRIIVNGMEVPVTDAISFSNITADTVVIILFGSESGCDLPEWTPGEIYLGGDRVHYDGQDWECKWWTKDAPGVSEWGPWKSLGPCAGVEYFYLYGESGLNGRITPDDYVFAEKGGAIAYEILPDAGFRTASVYVDGINQGPLSRFVFENIQQDHRISALFEPASSKFYITVNSGPNGTATPAGISEVIWMDSLRVDFLPDSGYRVAAITVDGQAMSVEDFYEFSNITEDHVLEVIFEPVQQDTWTVGMNYSTGDQVWYDGKLWRCKYAHTSLPDWYPGALGVWLWEFIE